MNELALIVGYAVIVGASIILVVVGLPMAILWAINASPLRRKVLYILRLGEKTYMGMPKKDRKY